jgi:hypothetical protein
LDQQFVLGSQGEDLFYSRQISPSDAVKIDELAHGWIDNCKIDQFLSGRIKIVSAVDGSEASTRAFNYVIKGLMQQDRESYATIVHVYDLSKEYLTPALRRGAIQSFCETTCVSHVLPSRYELRFIPRVSDQKVGVQLVQEVCKQNADFICMGICGRKPRERVRQFLASNIIEVLQHGACSCIVINTDDERELPFGRPTKFVVSLSLNVAATKAVIDALPFRSLATRFI